MPASGKFLWFFNEIFLSALENGLIVGNELKVFTKTSPAHSLSRVLFVGDYLAAAVLIICNSNNRSSNLSIQ